MEFLRNRLRQVQDFTSGHNDVDLVVKVQLQTCRVARHPNSRDHHTIVVASGKGKPQSKNTLKKVTVHASSLVVFQFWAAN